MAERPAAESAEWSQCPRSSRFRHASSARQNGDKRRPGEAKYVCLAGAGLSKDAGLPTAWDLMLETAALLRVAEEDDGTDLPTWFMSSRYKDMKYSELIGGLFNTSVEQQNFIRDKLKAEKPGEAHLLLAELAKRKVLRCIVTTNFDDLIEQALQQVGLSVQVIANDDDLKHSEPLIHCKQFRVYKPHGTLGVGRLRNTPADLEKLSSRMERELVKILKDHGLIVLGYAGADESILNVFRKRKQQFYPTFWLNPSEPPDTIPPYFASETFNYVSCKGASAVLTDLLETYRKLAALGPTSGVPAAVSEVRDALQLGRPNVGAAVRSFMTRLTDELKKISPDLASAAASMKPCSMLWISQSRCAASSRTSPMQLPSTILRRWPSLSTRGSTGFLRSITHSQDRRGPTLTINLIFLNLSDMSYW